MPKTWNQPTETLALDDFEEHPADRVRSGRTGGEGRFAAGTVLAERYRISGLLGRGGMGEVYRAEDLRLGQAVALKFLPELRRGRMRYRARFLNEVKLARRITHRNVCRVYDLGEVEGDPYLSMELVEGEDLASLLRRAGRPSQDRALEVARQICKGMAAAHEAGILHLDLKPGNLMLDVHGRVVIMDFGLASLSAVPGKRGMGSPGGTPGYMAPEQRAGEEVGTASDLYALGLVLYELFTGRRAVFGEGGRGPRRPSELVEDLDPAIDGVILRCLEREPSRRPASAREVLGALPGGAADVALKTLCAVKGEPAAELAALARRHGARQWSGDESHESVWIFDRPAAAVDFAVAGVGISSPVGLGIHLGEVRHVSSLGGRPEPTPGSRRVAGLLAGLASPGQALLTRGAFDLARQSPRSPSSGLRWLAHGEWEIAGLEEPLAIYEVGVEGRSPLAAPRATSKGRRRNRQETILGWRPGPGLEIPRRPGWRLERRLGEGGFGEVWLAVGPVGEIEERRVFKFCYEAERLRALKREITLFRLLKEELGERRDIARILDWNFSLAPYFIEMEYSASGDLAQWAASRGGISAVPLEERLEIVAQVATALGAAHSVGVLHKDIKPQNVLIHGESGPESGTESGPWRAQLTDFGVGLITERERLAAAGITALGWTETGSSASLDSGGSGTPLYMAPELLEGKAPTLQADVYALGVLLYQVAVGDLSRALATGWQREVSDEVLREDVSAAVEGSPERRLSSARELAERLRTLEARRRARRRRERARRSAARRKVTVRVLAVLLFVGAVIGVMSWVQSRRVAREAEAAQQVSNFLVDVFRVSDPEKALGREPTAREILDRGARRLDEELAGQPEIQARLLYTIGTVYRHLGHPQAAQPFLERSLALRRELHGDSHPTVAESLHGLGALRLEQGLLEEAVETLTAALEMRRRHLGDAALEVGETLDLLAAAYHRRGEYATAEPYYRQALSTLREAGASAEHESATMNNLATLLAVEGRTAAAESLYHEMLELQLRELGEVHPETARGLSNLGLLLQERGVYEAAEAHFERALAIHRQLYDEEHPVVSSSLYHLANLALSRGDLDRAEALFRQILERYRRALGDDHLYVASILNNLGYILFLRDDLDGARLLFDGSLAIRRRQFGDEGLGTTGGLTFLGLIAEARGDLDGAEAHYRQALEILRRDLGVDHVKAATLEGFLAYLDLLRGDTAAAEAKITAALEKLRRLPQDHWRRSVAASVRGAVLAAQGKVSEAEAVLERAHLELMESRGAHSHHTRAALERLARFYEASGRPDLAAARRAANRRAANRAARDRP